MALRTEHAGPQSLTVLDDGAGVCEILGLLLQNGRFRPGGRFLIGTEVPLPLYWEQYAGHEHPDRNAGSHGALRVVHQGEENVTIECLGTTASGEATSRHLLSIERTQNPVRYLYDIQAFLSIPKQKTWLVTPNPHHGELEFCNFWPDGAFFADLRKANRYRGCYVLHGEQVTMIPHHHLESADKHNLPLETGDRLTWLLEDENPVIEILPGDPITAGICAYMWDAHLAVKACHDGSARALTEGTSARAHIRLSSMDRTEGQRLVDRARVAVAPETYQVPVIVDGVHTFAETLASSRDPADVWPWETEGEGGLSGVHFLVDRATGYDDEVSLCIDAIRPVHAAWKATALGPAFRQRPFRDGERYTASGFVRTHLTEGTAAIALRLHRQGQPGLFDPSTYEVYRSPLLSGNREWTCVEAVTPALSPAPDRVHILLEVNGAGQCWFDNVQLLSTT
jgi:hypothetical protein